MKSLDLFINRQCNFIFKICVILILFAASVLNNLVLGKPNSDNVLHLSNGISLNLIGQVGGPTQAVDVKGNYAFAGIGMRMVVLNVSNPSYIQQIGETEVLGGFVTGVVVDGTLACVTAGPAGFYVVNIGDPTQPTVLGMCNTQGYSENVCIKDDYVYIADGWSGITIVDISDVSYPKEVGSLATIGYAFDVVVADNKAYVAAGGAGLKIVDVEYPQGPIEIGDYNTPGYAFGVAFSDEIVYIADGWEGLQIIDTSDSLLPVSLGSKETHGWAFNISIKGSIAYIADAFKGLTVIDISSPGNPIDLGMFDTGNYTSRVVVSDQKAYLADRSDGIRIIDISSASNPYQVGHYSPLGYASDLEVYQNHAYVIGAQYDLRVIDISDPFKAREVGMYSHSGNPLSISIQGQFAYITIWGPDEGILGVHIVDISNPINPIQAGVYSQGNGAYRDLAFSGGLICLPNEFGLELVDVSNPNFPIQAGFISLWEESSWDVTTGVDVSNNLAYVTVSAAGVKIVDISDPNAMYVKGTFKSESCFSEDITIVGNKAYVADYHGIRILDVSNPESPAELGFSNLRGEAVKVVVDGNIAYVANGSSGISVLDVSDPQNMQLLTEYKSPDNSHSVVLDGNTLYVADGKTGLLIFEIKHENLIKLSDFDYQDILSKKNPITSGFKNSPPYQWKKKFQKEEKNQSSQKPYISGFRPGKQKKLNTWIVTDASNDGEGSLRFCLDNVQSGDSVFFDTSIFPPNNPTVIPLSSPLPIINQGNITIDASNAGVILRGSGLSPDSSGIKIHSDGNIIRGLQILYCPLSAIEIIGNDNVIGGDRTIGSGPMGQGNTLSGNGYHGIQIQGDRNIIVGNLIGVSSSGTEELGNGFHGVFIVIGKNNRIGGSESWAQNIISGNGWSGVSFLSAGSMNNSIVGNYIGTGITGKIDFGNKNHGIAIEGGSCCLIKGNVVSGNGRAGILLSDGGGGSYNTVIGNIIGLDNSGTVSIGNDWAGIVVGTLYNRIGGMSPEERNIISGNNNGINMGMDLAERNIVVGNYIGTDISGGVSKENYVGIYINGNSHSFIGGYTDDEKNVISGNVYGFELNSAESNLISGNYLGVSSDGGSVLNNQIGIYVDSKSFHNTIRNNKVTGDVGITLLGNENLIRGNIFSSCGLGLDVQGGSSNYIYLNEFQLNQTQASDTGNNYWDFNGAGNYWSDYTGSDLDGNGIGDSVYPISAAILDHFPLISSTNYLTVWINPSGQGNVDITPLRTEYKKGENVRLQAVSTGIIPFSSWSDGCPENHEKDNPLTVPLYSGRTIVCNFTVEHTLILTSSAGGTTDPSPGSYTYNEGTQVIITARPDAGYRFSGWTGNASGTTNPLTITMDSDKSIGANFAQSSGGGESSGSEGSESSCFIATACYGTSMADEVLILSKFRDKYFMSNPVGRRFVNLYYKYSQGVADYIRSRERLKAKIRQLLKGIVRISASILKMDEKK